MLIEIVALFLGVSLLFYCLFAGADFGAGILEFFHSTENRAGQQEVISHAIAPVWEANHVWLILAVVILFNGFPNAYRVLSITFHIPLTLMLIGIILRGCAFTFRHYDAIKDKYQEHYTRIFTISSILTPFMLGVIAGGMLLGRYANPIDGFYVNFISPWLNPFCFAVGILTCTLFAFLAAVYLVGETSDDSLRRIFITRARQMNIASIVAGLLVFVGAYISEFSLIDQFSTHPVCIMSMGIATALLIPLWTALKRNRIWLSRLLAAIQTALVLLGWFALQFPTLIMASENGLPMPITIYNAAAPEATLLQLVLALVIGILIIFPALYLLFSVFKNKPVKG